MSNQPTRPDEVPDLDNAAPDSGFDVGTSPHGLSADLARQHQETLEAESLRSPAKLVLPLVYRSIQVRSACRALRAAFAKRPNEVHYLRLTDRQFLQVYSAVEHARSRTRKAIGKGIADIQDLRASDPLWDALQAVMVRRMKGYKL